MKKLSIFALVFILLPIATFAAYDVQTKTSGCLANQILPDPACSPGAVLTTNTKTICVVGYTKTVRDVPLSEKKKGF